MAEVCVLFRAEISVQLSGYDWASCTLVPEVVMFPAAQDIIGDRVEVVTTVFVTVIVVVTARKTFCRIVASGGPRRKEQIASLNLFPAVKLLPALTNITLCRVLPIKTGHVVTHSTVIVMDAAKGENRSKM